MARTWAQAEVERKRILRLGKRLQVRVVRKPIRGNDGDDWPGTSGQNEYMIEVRDPRTTNQGGVVSVGSPTSALAAGRWNNTASTNEHITRLTGPIAGTPDGTNVPNPSGWRLYGPGETRESSLIQNSASVFT
ncbi:MAG: hypothetical protein MK161_16710 [Pirellulales bacterium]|nr:hypothetical protein [Pirellulales bacterium]